MRAAHNGNMKILLVEDDIGIAEPLAKGLEREGFEVIRAGDGRWEMQAPAADVVILDLRLPDIDGYEVCRRLRARSRVPIIMVSARGEEVDRVIGLELGADDYIVKPFGLRELVARIRAVLRRQEMGRVARTRDPERGGYRFGGWQLERRERRLVDPNGAQVSLSKGEYALLLAFLEAPQRPLTREQLLQPTRVHEHIFDRSIDVQVLRLRRSLEAAPSPPTMILPDPPSGYEFPLPLEP